MNSFHELFYLKLEYWIKSEDFKYREKESKLGVAKFDVCIIFLIFTSRPTEKDKNFLIEVEAGAMFVGVKGWYLIAKNRKAKIAQINKINTKIVEMVKTNKNRPSSGKYFNDRKAAHKLKKQKEAGDDIEKVEGEDKTQK